MIDDMIERAKQGRVGIGLASQTLTLAWIEKALHETGDYRATLDATLDVAQSTI